MSNGGKFQFDVAAIGKRLCVTTNKGGYYQGIIEQLIDCPLRGAGLLLRDGTRLHFFLYSGIKEMEYEVVLNEDIDSRDSAVEVELEDSVENIGAKLVPAGNPMDNSG